MNLRQIVEAVHETTFFGVMMALLGADNHYEQWNRKHGTVHERPCSARLRTKNFCGPWCTKTLRGPL